MVLLNACSEDTQKLEWMRTQHTRTLSSASLELYGGPSQQRVCWQCTTPLLKMRRKSLSLLIAHHTIPVWISCTNVTRMLPVAARSVALFLLDADSTGNGGQRGGYSGAAVWGSSPAIDVMRK